MALFGRGSKRVTADALWGRWFVPVVPEGHPSLESYESLITDEERERLPKTLQKLAMDGVDRIYEVRRKEVSPDRDGLAYLDELLDAGLRMNLERDQVRGNPRSLFRIVATEIGCIVGEVYRRTDKGRWVLRRGPNHWRSHILSDSGAEFDPFRLVVRQMSDEREPGALVTHYDTFGKKVPGTQPQDDANLGPVS